MVIKNQMVPTSSRTIAQTGVLADRAAAIVMNLVAEVGASGMGARMGHMVID